MNQRSSNRAASSPLPACGGARSGVAGSEGGQPSDSEAARSPLPAQRGWKRYAIYAFAGLMVMVCVAIGALWGLIDSFGPAPLGRDLEMSKTVLDRNGRLLRSYVTSQGRWRLPATRRASRSALSRRAVGL